jgi:phosphate transport system permease protein
MVWLTAGGLAICLSLIVGLLGLVLWQGGATFWPAPVVQLRTAADATLMGEVTRHESFAPEPTTLAALPPELRARALAALDDGRLHRRLVRIGNYELTNEHFAWVPEFTVVEESRPEWALVVERREWGRFYGVPLALLVDGAASAEGPAAAWSAFRRHHGAAIERLSRVRALQEHDVGRVNRAQEHARLQLRAVELAHGAASPEAAHAKQRLEGLQQWASAEVERLGHEIAELRRENARFALRLTTADGRQQDLQLDDVVRAYPANQLGTAAALGVYLSRWWEFLTDDPREANSEGGVFPAIFGTVAMTLIMSILVVPLGVLAALYLREYAKGGLIVSAVRIAINNLAGVPSIVFGVFGLGFFCYLAGGSIDQLFFSAKLPTPTYGTGGLLWASLTLALLTLPVVIVATEEAIAAVPRSMREGSYACGASKWQTIRRIVLPRAMPGIMTGTILAIARGAGEVAPLMLVGAVKHAPELPIDGVFPWVHPERSFMHLGFHIYDVGFQSQNSEAAKPMVFTTTLLLIAIIALLNLVAVRLRARLRRRFVGAKF